jgi:hypothetical protein
LAHLDILFTSISSRRPERRREEIGIGGRADLALGSVAPAVFYGRREPSMNEPDVSWSFGALANLEAAWRHRVEEARRRYQVATERYHRLSQQSHGLAPTAESPLLSARHAQSAALDEYRRILGIFTALTVHGRIPEESSKNGVRT